MTPFYFKRVELVEICLTGKTRRTQATGEQISSNEAKWPEVSFGSRKDKKEIHCKGIERQDAKGQGRSPPHLFFDARNQLIYE